MKFKEWLGYRLWRKDPSPETALLALTYANDKNTDGAGSQLHRMYGVYALSRFLGLPYVHSPMIRLNYHGLAALESNTVDDGLVARYNQAFPIPSDISAVSDWPVRDLERATFGELNRLRREAKRLKQRMLVRCVYPFRIVDSFPEAYDAVLPISPFYNQEYKPLRIALHVRRGELFAVAASRLLPNAYYLAVAQKMGRLLKAMDIPYVIDLYTEMPQKAFEVTSQHQWVQREPWLQQGSGAELKEPVRLDPAMNRIEEFDALPHLTKYVNTDPIETLGRMASAHILVMSHSSFSYLAALLNPGVIAYHDFSHPPLKRWLEVDDRGEFSEKKFTSQVKTLAAVGPI